MKELKVTITFIIVFVLVFVIVCMLTTGDPSSPNLLSIIIAFVASFFAAKAVSKDKKEE